MYRDISPWLLKSFHRHGYKEAVFENGWVCLPGYPPARASSYSQTMQESYNLQLDFEFALDDGRVLTESIGGVGSTENEAIENGLQKFCSNVLHVLLSAFYNHPYEEHLEYEEWDLDGETWEVFFGPYGIVSMPTKGKTAQQIEPPEELFPFITTQLQLHPKAEDIHWVRFYYAWMDNNPMLAEALWDNEVWFEAQNKLGNLNWPEANGFTSVRSFILLRRKESAKQCGSLENAPAIERAISLYMDCILSSPDAEDETVYRHLLSQGVSASLADRAMVFTDMCFSNILFQEYDFPTTYSIYTDTPPYPNKSLIEEPVFSVGRRYAWRLSCNPDFKDAFMAMASRCSITKAVNQALHQGSNLKDIYFAPPVVFLNRFENASPLAMPDVRPPISEMLIKKEWKQRKRPWWHFW
ncbi:MAG: hypothetical protein JXR97_06650 [Planctomycetes bacterium]|nr:hypothetical protein [Planctomycetota bacterium]